MRDHKQCPFHCVTIFSNLKVFPGGEFEKVHDVVYLLDTWDTQMKRLQAGPFLSELVQKFDAFIANNFLIPVVASR